MKQENIHIQRYISACGELIIGSYNDNICLCDWTTEPHHNRVIRRLQRILHTEYTETTDDIISATIQQLDEYFVRRLQKFTIPLMFVGTDFQQTVWHELMHIPYGQTISYRDIAKRIGRTEAVRAVANAIGQNAMSIIVPCHRVVGCNGLLTGYAGGLTAKHYLLKMENANCVI